MVWFEIVRGYNCDIRVVILVCWINRKFLNADKSSYCGCFFRLVQLLLGVRVRINKSREVL